MKIIASIAGGMGNMIEMTAAIRTMRERLGYEVDVHTTGTPWSHADIDPIFETQGCKVYNNGNWDQIGEDDYDGIVFLGYGRPREQKTYYNGLRVLNDTMRQAVNFKQSEVDVSMNACRDLGVPEEDLIWEGDINWNRDYPERVDIVLANGYYRKDSGYWDVKGYPGFQDIATGLRDLFPGYRIGSIGKDGSETIPGTEDFTGINILDALTLIKGARFIVCTDSMAHHAAGALGKRSFAIFTATSRVKNYDSRFHANTVLVGRKDLECREECQVRGAYWRRCPTRECQDIDAGKIVDDIAYDVLYGRPLDVGAMKNET